MCGYVSVSVCCLRLCLSVQELCVRVFMWGLCENTVSALKMHTSMCVTVCVMWVWKCIGVWVCTFICQHSVPVSKYLRELSCTRKGLFGAQVSIDPVQDQLLPGKGASPLARLTYCNRYMRQGSKGITRISQPHSRAHLQSYLTDTPRPCANLEIVSNFNTSLWERPNLQTLTVCVREAVRACVCMCKCAQKHIMSMHTKIST